MKRFLIASLLAWSTFAQAGLPPTSSKGNGESTYSTTFKTNYDTIPVTRSGTTVTIGTIPVAKGGTGSTSLSANNVLLGNGTSALQVVAPGTSGNVLTSNGTTWSSSAPATISTTAYARADTSNTSFPASTTTTITFSNETADTDNIFNPATGQYTCNQTMDVEVSLGYVASAATGTGVAGNVAIASVYKGASEVAALDVFTAEQTGTALIRNFSGSAIVSCVNTDVLTVRIGTQNDSTFSGQNNSYRTWVVFKRVK